MRSLRVVPLIGKRGESAVEPVVHSICGSNETFSQRLMGLMFQPRVMSKVNNASRPTCLSGANGTGWIVAMPQVGLRL